jgi:hypothetical protein
MRRQRHGNMNDHYHKKMIENIPRAMARCCTLNGIKGKRKGCGAHRQANQELIGAAFRFARVSEGYRW